MWKFPLVFWSMRRYHNFLLRFTDLCGSNFCNLYTLVVWMSNLKIKYWTNSKIHSQIWSWNPSVRVMGLAWLPYAFLTRQKELIAGHSAPWLKANRAFLGCLTNLCRLNKIIGRALLCTTSDILSPAVLEKRKWKAIKKPGRNDGNGSIVGSWLAASLCQLNGAKIFLILHTLI